MLPLTKTEHALQDPEGPAALPQPDDSNYRPSPSVQFPANIILLEHLHVFLHKFCVNFAS